MIEYFSSGLKYGVSDIKIRHKVEGLIVNGNAMMHMDKKQCSFRQKQV